MSTTGVGWRVFAGAWLLGACVRTGPGPEVGADEGTDAGRARGASKPEQRPEATVVVQRGRDLVVRAAFGFDGRVLATCDYDSIRIWDVPTGSLRGTLGVAHTGSLAFTPDGETLVLGNAGGVSLWDTATATQRATLADADKHFPHVALSPDGQTIVTMSGDGAVDLWSTETGELQQGFANPGVNLSVGFGPGAGSVTVANVNRASVWDIATGSETVLDIEIIKAHARPNISALVLGRRTGELSIWRPGEPDAIELGTRLVSGRYSPLFERERPRFWMVEDSGAISGWDLEGGNARLVTRCEAQAMEAIGLDEAGQRLVVIDGEPGQPTLWDLETCVQLDRLDVTLARSGWAIFDPSGANMLLVGNHEAASAQLWRVATGEPARATPLGADFEYSNRVYPSRGARRIITTGLDSFSTWNLDTMQVERALPLEPGEHVAASTPDASLVLTRGRERMRVWDLDAGVVRHTHEDSSGGMLFGFSSDGSRLYIPGHNDSIVVLDTATGQSIATFKHQRPWAAALSEDGRLFAAIERDWALRVRDVDTNKVQLELANTVGSHVAINAKLGQVAALTGKGLEFWDLRTGALLEHRVAMPSSSSIVEVVPGEWLIDLGTVKITDVAQRRSFDHGAEVTLAELGPNRATLLTLSEDAGTAKIWDVASGELRATVDVPQQKRALLLGSSAPTELILVSVGDGLSIHAFDADWQPRTLDVNRLRQPNGTIATLISDRAGGFAGDAAAIDEAVIRLGPSLFHGELRPASELVDTLGFPTLVRDFWAPR